MKDEIKVSIIVATAEREKELKEFLQGLKNAGILSRKDAETIIIDNNQDYLKMLSSKKLCEEYGAVFCHETVTGKSFAINKGIKTAKGKYLAFTDDDVIVKDPRWLDIMVEKLENNPRLGYISGNVVALKTETAAEKIWEKKGGLSKGSLEKHWDRNFLNSRKFRILPWPFYKMCAGANSMIPRKVIEEIGPYNTLLENPTIPAGGTTEIGYRVAKKGYELLYTPDSQVFHRHPETKEALKKKMFFYGMGDTACPMCIFTQWGDFRYLWWALFGHALYTLSKLMKRLFGKYDFPSIYIIKNLQGNVIGHFVFIYYYIFKRK